MGDATVSSVLLHDDVELREITLHGIEVEWPPGDDDSTPGRLRSPIDAPAVFRGVSFRLAASARLPTEFFDVPASGVPPVLAVERVEGRTTLRAGRLRIEGVAVRCVDLEFGRAARWLPPTRTESSLGGYRVDDGLELRAEPRRESTVVRVSSLDGASHELTLVERRGRWARLVWPISAGLALHGWVRVEPDRETPYASGTGGFEGRSASVSRGIGRTDGCYLGPAFFRPAAPVYGHERDTEPWGTLVDGDEVWVEDCGTGDRVEIVYALGREASFGWVDALDVTRLGAARCSDGVVLLQSPASYRIVVAESGSHELAVGDEIVRFGGEPILGLFDTVVAVFPHEVCAAWTGGAVLEVVRDGERRRVVRDDAE